jgi:hypothetical protein
LALRNLWSSYLTLPPSRGRQRRPEDGAQSKRDFL